VFTASLAGVSLAYTAVSGDTVLAPLATHLAAAIAVYFPNVVTAAAVGAVITVTSAITGTLPNSYKLTVSKTGTGSGTIITGGATLAGGADGNLFITPAVDRVTFLENGHRERLTLVGIGAGVNL
jgi:phage tail sheath gpL-like